jgi:hypothetical protein
MLQVPESAGLDRGDVVVLESILLIRFGRNLHIKPNSVKFKFVLVTLYGFIMCLNPRFLIIIPKINFSVDEGRTLSKISGGRIVIPILTKNGDS